MAKALPILAVHPQGLLAENAPLILHTRLEEVYRWSTEITDPLRVAELHNMRIAAKRLRYTLEIFASCFAGKDYKLFYEQVKSIQEQIGEIHDADVRGVLFQNYLDRHSASQPEIRVGLEALIKAEHEARMRLYGEFILYWSTLQRQHFKSRFLKWLAETLTDPENKENKDVTSEQK